MKKAVQQIMLGTVTGSESRARETLQKIKAAGYDGLELNRFMIHPSSLMVRLMTRAAGMPTGNGGKLDWHALLKESGLSVISLHADLGSLEREPFDRVSDGQRQLVRLARALCQQPRVLLLDEPTSFLDVRYKLRLLEILRELVRERKLAVLMSVHELDIALKAPDRVLLLKGGRQLALSSPEDLARGNQVAGLFGLSGGFVPEYACLEPAFAKGEPQVFVAGRQGALGAYRLLSRRGIPFACGVLEEGDLVCPAARVLASRVVTAAEKSLT